MQTRWGKKATRASLVGGLALVLVFSSAVAAAQVSDQPPAASSVDAKSTLDQESQRLFDDGVAAYDAGDYDVAIVRFRAAYARTQAAALLFNIAQALRRKGDCAGALQAYRSFMNLSPDKAKTLEVDNRIAEMVTFCPIAPGPSPADERPIGAKNGANAVSAPGARDVLPVSAVQARTPPTSSSSRQRTWRSTVGWSCLGFGLGGAAVGGYSAYAAHRTSERISTLTEQGVAWNGFATELDQQGQNQRDLARIGFIAAGTGLAVGAGLLIWEQLLLRRAERP